MSMLRVTLSAPRTTLLQALLALALMGCAGADEVARDEPTPPPSPSASTPADDDGFPPSDYRYLLEMTCYCPYAAVPVRVEVAGDEVVAATFVGSGGRGGASAGEAAPELLRLTIEDVIAEAEAARASGAHEVEVTWPEGSDHPTEVYIDRVENAIDEEIGYRISEVEVLDAGTAG